MASAKIRPAAAARRREKTRSLQRCVRRVGVVRGCAAASHAFSEPEGNSGGERSLGKRIGKALQGFQAKLRERAAKNAAIHADPAVLASTRKTAKDVYIFRSILPLSAAASAAVGAEALDINYLLKGLCVTFGRFLELYSAILVIKILVSWFPNIDITMEPFRTLDQVTEPFFILFRSLLPPIFGIDFTPILGMMAIGFVQQILFDFGFHDMTKESFEEDMLRKQGIEVEENIAEMRDMEALEELDDAGFLDTDFLEQNVATRSQLGDDDSSSYGLEEDDFTRN